MRDYIRDDSSVSMKINYDGESQDMLISAKYDRLDHFERLGLFILKVVDPEYGFIQMILSPEDAAKVIVSARLPVVEREFIFQSEYDFYMEVQAKNLDDSWLDDAQEG